MKKVAVDELRRGDLIIVRWHDASDTRGFIEDLGEPQWCKDWGFYLGIVGKKRPELLVAKDVAEGHPCWGISKIPLDLIEEVWLWIPCEETGAPVLGDKQDPAGPHRGGLALDPVRGDQEPRPRAQVCGPEAPHEEVRQGGVQGGDDPCLKGLRN